jgi:hypothetical protein
VAQPSPAQVGSGGFPLPVSSPAAQPFSPSGSTPEERERLDRERQQRIKDAQQRLEVERQQVYGQHRPAAVAGQRQPSPPQQQPSPQTTATAANQPSPSAMGGGGGGGDDVASFMQLDMVPDAQEALTDGASQLSGTDSVPPSL